jgi:hypothetical protein
MPKSAKRRALATPPRSRARVGSAPGAAHANPTIAIAQPPDFFGDERRLGGLVRRGVHERQPPSRILRPERAATAEDRAERVGEVEDARGRAEAPGQAQHARLGKSRPKASM